MFHITGKKDVVKFVYPAILGVLFIIVFVILRNIVVFSEKVVDGIFEDRNSVLENQLTKVNVEGYKTVASKLGLSFPDPAAKTVKNEVAEEKITPTSSSEVLATTTSTTLVSTTTGAIISLDRGSLHISILNATKTNGLAQSLKEYMEEEGFKVDKVGSVQSKATTTLMQIKDSRSEYLEMIRTSLLKKYPNFQEAQLSESEVFDVVITIK